MTKNSATSSAMVGKQLVFSRQNWRLITVFLSVEGLYLALSCIPWVDRNLVYPVLTFTAHGAAFTLNLIGYETEALGALIRGRDFSVMVRRGYDPLDPIALLAGALCGFPATWRRRLMGLACGVAVLIILNQVRIVSLYLVGKNFPSWFYSLHQEWWPALFVLTALAIWLIWLRWVSEPHRI